MNSGLKIVNHNHHGQLWNDQKLQFSNANSVQNTWSPTMWCAYYQFHTSSPHKLTASRIQHSHANSSCCRHIDNSNNKTICQTEGNRMVSSRSITASEWQYVSRWCSKWYKTPQTVLKHHQKSSLLKSKNTLAWQHI